MESSSAIASSSYAEDDVMVIAPPPPLADRTSKLKAKGKQKQVANHEIIDVDMDEDCDDDDDDVVILGGTVESRKRAKGGMGTSLGPSSSAAKFDSNEVASSKKGKGIPVEPGYSSNGFNAGSDNFFDLDDYVYDDDYWALQSHFDKIDLPAGIEAPVPWFTDLVPTKKENRGTPFVTSDAKVEASASQPNRGDSWLQGSAPMKGENPAFPFVTSKSKFEAGMSQPNRVDSWLRDSVPLSTPAWFSSSNPNTAAHGQSTDFDSKHIPAQIVHSNLTQFGRGNGYRVSNSSNTQVGNGTSSFPSLAMNTAYPLGAGGIYSTLKNRILSRTAGIYSMNDNLLSQDATVNGSGLKSLSSVESTSSLAKHLDGDVQKRYESFKKFDTVMDHADHYYANKNSAMNQAPKNWAKKIQEEWKILEKDLPDTIFVRAYESRMDLLRAVIIGAEGTPYHDGLFFFDVCFPSNYPNSPPLVHYHSGGLRINPNLYACGKVCLSLLNTWSGDKKEKWIPGTSTMLQVLVSIQGLILNMKPYFNEPGFAHSRGSVHGERASLQYNENTLILSLKTMVYSMNRPPKNFEDLVIGHFRHRVRDILMACKAYTEGVQVGCLVKGGVQDVDEGNNSCSAQFKHDVGSCIKMLVAAFKKIGAEEAHEFLSLSVEESSLLSAPTPTATPTPNLFPTLPQLPPQLANIFPPFHLTSISPYNQQHW